MPDEEASVWPFEGRQYPTRVRAGDAVRLVRKFGRLNADTGAKVLRILSEMFAP